MRVFCLLGIAAFLAARGLRAEEAAPAPQVPGAGEEREAESPPFSAEDYLKDHTPEERDTLVNAVVLGGGGRYEQTGAGGLVDRGVEPPRPLSVREAERLRDLYLLEGRLKMPPRNARDLRETAGMLRRTAGAMEADPMLFFGQHGPEKAPELARTAAAGLRHLADEKQPLSFGTREARTTLALVDPGWGNRPSGPPPRGRTAAEVAAAARRAPRARSTVSSRVEAPPEPGTAGLPRRVARQVAGFREDVTDLDGRFRDAFQGSEGRRPQGSWMNNACRGETCGLYAQTYRGMIQKQEIMKKYPDLELVTLYQPGRVEDTPILNLIPGVARAGNHEFLGIAHTDSAGVPRLIGYVDAWSNHGGSVYHPYTGRGDLPLDRPWLGVIRSDGTGFKVGNDGRPLR